MIWRVLVAVMFIYLSASLISLARIYLFKLLRVHKGVDYLAELPGRISEKLKARKAKGAADSVSSDATEGSK